MIISRLIPNKFIKYLKNRLGVPNQASSLLRLKELGFEPQHILDIGAYEGHWALEVAAIFPKAHILMIEGQKAKEDILSKRLNEIPNTELRIALLGAETKNVTFNIYETASSVFKEDNETNAKIEQIELQLLDQIVADTRFEKTDLIKLDTQGYELEILKGGIKTLQSAQLVLIEVSLLGIYKGAPLVDEVIHFMKSHGFILYDICTLMRRPYDNALYQSDFLFIKQNHPLIASTRWD
ncbi:FkbM family methyltransferase [Pedobacter sp. UC225_65]|uniref:FkbM family methyltransferase n=1 Tax=Pedobacter sp. UC225_65 TaxID=3350173 RepID=UPI00366E214B